MRITVDTNVLFSAAFWYGDSHKIIEKVENQELELVLSKEIIEEFEGVLGYEEVKQKIRDKDLEMKKSVEKIVSVSEIVDPKIKFKAVKEDSRDDKILECAFEGKVGYVVTQDNHLLKLRKFRGIRIVTPEGFLEILEKK